MIHDLWKEEVLIVMAFPRKTDFFPLQDNENIFVKTVEVSLG